MNKKRIRVTAGVLSIIGGILQLLFGTERILWYSTFYIRFGKSFSQFYSSWFNFLIITVLLICGIIAVTGGIFTFKRKRWKLSFAGSVAAGLPLWIILVLGGVEIELPYKVALILLGIISLAVCILVPNAKISKPGISNSLIYFFPVCTIVILVLAFSQRISELLIILFLYIFILALLILIPVLTFHARGEFNKDS